MTRVIIKRFQEGLHNLLCDSRYAEKSYSEAETIVNNYLQMFTDAKNYEKLSVSAKTTSRLYYPDSFKESKAS